MAPQLSSGDVARATGCTLRAVRFYEQQGLLAPSVVSEGGHRRYTADDLERLRLIADLRELGLSLGEIRQALELRAGSQGGADLAQRFRDVLVGHIERARRRLERLRRVKRELESALEAVEARLGCEQKGCPCESAEAVEGPRIIKLLSRGALCGPPGSEGEPG
jgi:DNA-binding transcriptional MerR regulator